MTQTIKAHFLEPPGKKLSLTEANQETSGILVSDIWDTWERYIQAAKSSVIVLSPYITDLPEVFFETLIGRRVYTRMETQNFLSGASSLELFKRLFTENIPVFHVPKLHAKLLFTDGQLRSLGSQNFTRQGRRNLEASYLIDEIDTFDWSVAELRLGDAFQVPSKALEKIKMFVSEHSNDYNELMNRSESLDREVVIAVPSTPGGDKENQTPISSENDQALLAANTENNEGIGTLRAGEFHTGKDYEPLILRILAEKGGVTRPEMLEEVEIRMRNKFTQADFKLLGKNGPRWKNIVSRTKKTLIHDGYLRSDVGSLWELTQHGMRMYRRHSVSSVLDPDKPLNRKHRSKDGTFTSGRAMEEPILRILGDNGGELSRAQVLTKLDGSRIFPWTSEDLKNNPKGGLKWQDNASRARVTLMEEGYVIAQKQGYWTLSEEGWKRYRFLRHQLDGE